MGALLLVFIIYFLFANTLLRSITQNALGNASGVEVNIADVDHRFFPFGVTLTHLQATDNANPIRNKIEIASIKADVGLLPLLNKKLIIEELIVQDVEFNTHRTSMGDVYVVPDSQTSTFAFPSLEDLPSVDEVLEKSPLKTTAAVAEAKKVVERYQQPLKQKYALLPNKNKLEIYKERLKALQETDYKNPADLAAAKKEFDQIKDAIKQYRNKLTAFVDLAKEAKVASSNSLAALKTAPQEDYDLLKGLVAGDEGAIGQVTQHLFGDKGKAYAQGLLVVMDMLSGNGVEEPLAEELSANDGLPQVWIKKAAINIKWQQ
jgi:uncharacterized protein (TIGR03545 family)